MDFSFSDEQRAFAESVAGFARAKIGPFADDDDRLERFRRELVTEMAGMGLTGLRVPEELGGQGADAVTCGIACEEISKVDLSAAYIILLPALVTEILVNASTDKQAATWLPEIASGEALPALCLTEPDHGSDAAALSLRAERDGEVPSSGGFCAVAAVGRSPR